MPTDERAPNDGGHDPDLITLAEAAGILSVSVRTVRRLIQHGYLEGYRVGPRLLRVLREDVERVARRMPGGYEPEGEA